MTVLLPGVALTDHTFTVPLDHGNPGGQAIEVFAREAVDPARRGEDLPWLLFLQGGPGGKSPRPTSADGWLGHALRTHRVLLLDQRGTGRSTPVTGRRRDLADQLHHFRADAIVADAELIRRRLGAGPWDTLGQSYGGFITLTYLSQAPEGLRRCFVTGGLAGLDATADDVYARTYPRVLDKYRRYLARFPGDVARIEAIVGELRTRDVRLPDGDRLTVRRFQTLGMMLGTGDGAQRLHWLLDEGLTDGFLQQCLTETSFADNPLYAVLHESIYSQGPATAWSAARLLPAEFAEDAAVPAFTGEMIYPWMFDDIRALRPFKPAADRLAARTGWPPLYDPVRLAANEVPVFAAVYHDDMYVDAELSLETARRVGNVRTWVTNEWEHDGVRVSGGQVLVRLMDMASGRI
ncbi:alpha/beta hydrolase [Acrocarpospora phusangensis]|uniref:Alpha/beta hydrolase n=1 Tax=Acrocarpospora phusangensis TaxID=1070424 RepID=A0A919QBI2_9ACTN|nr:alpha/beta fold hydrolase [Acrocarpospora phusangensis]GIH24343.1 alpha/beta hydrolase [Acrocarpospora phusangensis]